MLGDVKTRLALALSSLATGFAVAPIAAASPPAEVASKPSSMQSVVRQVVRQDHAYDPTVRERALAEEAVGGSVVQMEPFEVTELKDHDRLDRGLREQRARDAKTRPGLANGVTVPGLPGVGITPYEDVIPFGPPMPRWSLVKIPW